MKFIRKYFLLLFLFFLVHFISLAQTAGWEMGFNYFFDNAEFSGSSYVNDQTMKGLHVAPQLTFQWENIHSFFVGTDLLNISGSKKAIEKVELIAYYQLFTPKILLRAGSFPRSDILTNYSDFFFQDSVEYFKPNIEGLFWQINHSSDFFNLWLDWTGHQTATQRESFFVGASGVKHFKNFFADFQSYMFHYANTAPRNIDFHVCDNVLMHLSLGINLLENRSKLDTLFFAVGLLQGFERERGLDNMTFKPSGIVLRGNIQYNRFGSENSFYIGDKRMRLYNKHGNNLYWNNPFLRGNSHLESEWYWKPIQTSTVEGKLALRLHLSEGKLFTEQLFTLKVLLDHSFKKNSKTIACQN